MSEAAHNSAIVDQFTRQAEVFNVAPSLTNEQALRDIVAATQAGPDDTVLDVACGGRRALCVRAARGTCDRHRHDTGRCSTSGASLPPRKASRTSPSSRAM